MTTTETETAPLTNCPACGSHVLFTVSLDYGVEGGYRADHFGVEPVQGDTITRCDDCAAFFVHAPDGTVAGATAPALAPATSSEPPASGGEPTADELEWFEKIAQSILDGALASADARIAELEAELAAAKAAPAGPSLGGPPPPPAVPLSVAAPAAAAETTTDPPAPAPAPDPPADAPAPAPTTQEGDPNGTPQGT